MKRILITGINGFIGRNIAEQLSLIKQYEISGVDLDDSFISGNKLSSTINYYQLDISNIENIKTFFEVRKFDVLIHLAGILSKDEDSHIHEKMIDVNFRSTSFLLEIAREQNLHFIFTSTAMVYGDQQGPFHEKMMKKPGNFYALTKSLSEDVILYFNKNFHIDYTIFRPAIIYGRGQKGDAFIPSLINSLENNQKYKMTKGEQTRDFIYIDDFVEAVKSTIDKRHIGIFNIGSGEGVAIKTVAELIARKLGAEDRLELGALPYRDNEIWNYALSYNKLNEIAGWYPEIDIEQGIDNLLGSNKDH